jgi:hypothetical protein
MEELRRERERAARMAADEEPVSKRWYADAERARLFPRRSVMG